MAELIAFGNTSATSSDFTVVAGTPKSLYIKPEDAVVNGDALFLLQHKDSGGTYTTIANLTPQNITQFGTITGAGTFRVVRQPSAFGGGLDLE
jgi:hypothetical protein